MNRNGHEPTKHAPFHSIYRENFEVVEQRQGKVRMYPHTEQLPVLSRALNLEFYSALPDRVARVDHRGDGFHKLLIKEAAFHYCTLMNMARPDRLRLYALLNHDLVAKVCIVQQVTEEHQLGPCHRFRFYSGTEFFPDVYLSGKELVFADHVLQRFSSRVGNRAGEDLSSLLLAFYGCPLVSMPVGPGRGFVVSFNGSLLAFTFKESETEYFITTCLTMNEINSVGLDIPPLAYNLHYGPAFTKPKIRNWSPTTWLVEHFKCWQRKDKMQPLPHRDAEFRWHWLAHWSRDYAIKRGHGPGSRVCFLDNIPGPCLREYLPTETEPQYDELAELKARYPEYDWDAIFAEPVANGTVKNQPSL